MLEGRTTAETDGAPRRRCDKKKRMDAWIEYSTETIYKKALYEKTCSWGENNRKRETAEPTGSPSTGKYVYLIIQKKQTNKQKTHVKKLKKEEKQHDGACSADQIAGYIATFARKEAPVCNACKARVQQEILHYIAEQSLSEQQHKDTLAATIATLNWKKLLQPKKEKGKGIDGTSSWLWWTLQTIDNTTMNIVGSAVLNCDFPDVWKKDLKVPVQKPNKSDAPENIRPIALVSELAKITEGVIGGCAEWMMEHDKEQGGWTPATSQIQRAWMLWSILVYRKLRLLLPTIIVFVDMAHFFDTMLVLYALYALVVGGLGLFVRLHCIVTVSLSLYHGHCIIVVVSLSSLAL